MALLAVAYSKEAHHMKWKPYFRAYDGGRLLSCGFGNIERTSSFIQLPQASYFAYNSFQSGSVIASLHEACSFQAPSGSVISAASQEVLSASVVSLLAFADTLGDTDYTSSCDSLVSSLDEPLVEDEYEEVTGILALAYGQDEDDCIQYQPPKTADINCGHISSRAPVDYSWITS